MPIGYSTVTDNSLLPFNQPGGVSLPNQNYVNSGLQSLTNIFENGLRFGALTYTGFNVNMDGTIQFATDSGFQQAYLRPVQNTYNSTYRASGVDGYGVYIDENTTRDSIVITWYGVGNRYQWNNPSTFQIELMDRGDGDMEMIVRMDEIASYYARAYGTNGAISWGPHARVPMPYQAAGVPFDQWESIVGNTGVEGVWQVRFDDGVLNFADTNVGNRQFPGTTGADSLTGYLGDDILRGFEGNDTLNGNVGNDSITGDDGDDVIDGSYGNDYITGGIGHDDIRGGDGNDMIGAGDGNDTVNGGNGHDIIHGGEGDNRLTGGEGNDTISSGTGADAIDAGNGNNLVNAGSGNDTITGGWNYDTIHGGIGDDLIVGGGGNDYLTGGLGNDTINGGDGYDYILAAEGDDVVYTGTGRDTVYGGDGHDRIVAETDRSYNRNQFYGMEGNDTLTGGEGYDTILGGAGDDEIRGRGGYDLLAGGDGNDRILGDDGNLSGANDTLYGGDGNDWVFGGAGHDSIDGNEGNDTLLGGNGNDLLNGGVGDDFIFGGLGQDTLTGGPGADRFLISSFREDAATVITDYNATEGDWLVMPGDQFDPADLRLVGDRMYNLDGSVAEYVSVSLVRIGPAGGIAQTLFQFDNPSQLDQLILRFPFEDQGQTLVLDLF